MRNISQFRHILKVFQRGYENDSSFFKELKKLSLKSVKEIRTRISIISKGLNEITLHSLIF